jgi:hypothetical protein
MFFTRETMKVPVSRIVSIKLHTEVITCTAEQQDLLVQFLATSLSHYSCLTPCCKLKHGTKIRTVSCSSTNTEVPQLCHDPSTLFNFNSIKKSADFSASGISTVHSTKFMVCMVLLLSV